MCKQGQEPLAYVLYPLKAVLAVELFFQVSLVNIKQIKVNLLLLSALGQILQEGCLISFWWFLPGAPGAWTSPGALWEMDWTGIG